jgi:hypothetical protein
VPVIILKTQKINMKMKTKTISSLLIPFALVATLFLSACEDDAEKTPNTSEATKKEKVNKVLDFREDLDFVNRFVNENVTTISSEEGRSSFATATIARMRSSAPCVETIKEEFPDGSTRITMNFGDGCQTDEGAEVSGTVVMAFSFSGSTIEYSLEFIDYSELSSGEHQGEIVNGTVSGSFVLDLEAEIFTQEMEQDLTITYANNTEAKYKVAQASEMTDNGLRVISLTTSGNFADGGSFAMTLRKNLVYDFSCAGNFPIEGEEMLVFQGNSILVNYGNRTCDRDFSVK